MDSRNNNTKKSIVIILIIINIITVIIGSGLGYFIGSKSAFKNPDIEDAEYRNTKIKMIEDYINKAYLRDVDEEAMFEGQLKGMVASLGDPYSSYMTKEEFKDLLEETSGSFGGIGVVVTPGEDGFIQVVSPIAGTPGDKAGIKSGDRIFKVNDEEFTADEMDEAVKTMKGEPGTKVKLTILRGKNIASMEEIDLELTREEIVVETVLGDIIEKNIGYIGITSFDEKTHEDFVDKLKELEKKGMEKLIIDLRGNPGGLLNITADIADELLGEADIVYTEDKNGNREYLKSDEERKVDYPIVLLINGGSASASEILAGALKDNERALLIGEKTFGKGVVQRLKDFPDGSGMKLTISEFFTPKGNSIHDVGIEPDIKVELPEDVEGVGLEYLEEDTQLQRAIEEIKKID